MKHLDFLMMFHPIVSKYRDIGNDVLNRPWFKRTNKKMSQAKSLVRFISPWWLICLKHYFSPLACKMWMYKVFMNENHFSSRRTKAVSLNGTEMSNLVLLTFRVLSTDSLTVRNIDSQNPGDDANLLLHCNPLVCQQEPLENISIWNYPLSTRLI